jgi:hypothetical protein|tara:strand:- start:648 stop:1043 length:396 start_codon:yes stop_codon:yes gene_type:complete
MNEVKVYHSAMFGRPDSGFSLVAKVAVPEDKDPMDCLEYAFRWTNNVNGSWSKEEVVSYMNEYGDEVTEANGDYNKDVTSLAILEDGLGARSTSVEDRMILNGVVYKVAGCGFEELDLTPAEINVDLFNRK